ERGILELIVTRELEPGNASIGRARMLRLAPFSEKEAEETIERLLPGVDPFVAATIRRDSGGNALFLEELCHSAGQDSGAGPRARRTLHARIAEAVRTYVAQGAHEELFESLAYHYGAADNALEAARYAELAGDKALGASALDRAQAQYRAALDAIDQIEPSR